MPLFSFICVDGKGGNLENLLKFVRETSSDSFATSIGQKQKSSPPTLPSVAILWHFVTHLRKTVYLPCPSHTNMTITESFDIKAIQSLADKCYMDAYKDIHTEEQNRFSFNEMYSEASLRHQIEEQHSRFFILEDNGIQQGYVAIYPITELTWMLDKLYLLPSSKGKGYGRALVEHADRIIKSTNHTCSFQVLLKVNRRNSAVKFYEHLGFTIIREWDRMIADGRWVMGGYDMIRTV